MKSVLLIVTLAFCAGTARAECPPEAELLVSCTFNGGSKVLTTCLVGDQVTYEFGNAGHAPDLALTRHLRDVDLVPWPGIGRTIWEEFIFENNGFRYSVHYGIDRLTDENMTGGVVVSEAGEEIASLECDVGSVKGSGYALPLFDAKEAAGQVYSHKTKSWK